MATDILRQARSILSSVSEYGCMACHGTMRMMNMGYGTPFNVVAQAQEEIAQEKEAAANEMACLLIGAGIDPLAIKRKSGESVLREWKRGRWEWNGCYGVEEFMEQLKMILGRIPKTPK